ncbi:MAG: polyprenyl synthetase family protein [Tannerella sp.]|jgi:geranylgeranyl diphosphate synthase type II|nr:polyprenyl synthetase family protein [Tannerella sp.]
MHSYQELLREVEKGLDGLHFETPPESLYTPIAYTLSAGGKRLRPVLTLMAADLYGAPLAEVLPVALCMEVFHNFTLLHDDLMDKADKRRNRPTVHKKWNPNTAILSGDAMLITAYRLLADGPSESLKGLFDLFTATALEICEGQMFDMEYEGRPAVSEAEYLEMIRLKTAVLLACSLKAGALAASAPEAEASCLYRFGLDLGLAFQLQDDLLDVYGDEATFGKPIGGDILSNKKTFPLIYALAQAAPAERRLLQDWLTRTAFDPAEKIAAFHRVYETVGLPQVAEQRICAYHAEALAELSACSLPPDRLRPLQDLAARLLHRQK